LVEVLGVDGGALVVAEDGEPDPVAATAKARTTVETAKGLPCFLEEMWFPTKD
jgi:hypothetical protein